MMNLLQRFINSWWKITSIIIILVLLSILAYFAITFVPMISHVKSYVSAIQNDSNSENLKNSSNLISHDLDRAFQSLNNPILKQLLTVSGLDFSIIAPELKGLILASPEITGATKTKKFMIAFQNSAEARGTGGILGAFAIIAMENGHLRVERTGSNIALKSLNEIPIPVPNEYTNLYRSDPAIWQNSNLSPHFPYGAKIWMALWEKQYNEKLDGVFAIDPTALSYILKATGPVQLVNGEKIDSDNVVFNTLSGAYKRFEKDNLARKKYLVDIINATFSKIVAGDFSKIPMAKAFRKGILENRILFFSNDSLSQESLFQTRLSGNLTAKANNQFRVVIQNIDASKLDYYLDRKIYLKSLSCEDPRITQISVVVTNSLKTGVGLPAYVLTRADKTKPIGMITGQHRFLVFIYGPVGSSLVHAKRSSTFGSAGGVGTELGRPILVSDVDLSPLMSERITATFTRGSGKLTYFDQPLVRKSSITITDKCKGQ
jgi:hypothetical protein